MSNVNAVLSFLTSTPANNKANTPESVMKTTAPSADTLALLRAYDQGQIASQQAEINRLRAALAAATVQVSLLKAESNETLEAVESERRWFGKNLESAKAEVSHWKWQAEGLSNTANNNAKTANKLADDLDQANYTANKLTADLDQANYVADMNFATAKKQAALAETFRNIARSSKARKSSNFALPIVEGEVTSLELSWLYRQALATALIDDVQRRHYGGEEAEVASRKLVGFGKDNVEGAYHCRACRKVEAHRGHRNGHVPMSAREAFHYLNR